MKLLHTADIHLREENEERWDALCGIIELGKKESIEAMIISGDLFDADIDALKLKGAMRELFTNVGYDIIIIPGNHDAKSYDDRAFFGASVKVLRSLEDRYETDDAVISGLPFKNIKEQEIYPILRNISDNLNGTKSNILMYHGELLDSYYSAHDFGNEGGSRYMPVRLDFFAELQFDYILAGHFHTNFSTIEFGKSGGTGYFVFPGSPVSVTKRETGKRKVNLLKTGGPPRELFIDSFFYEAINIKLDPFIEMDPVAAVKRRVDAADRKAEIILTVEGYLNSIKHGIDETKLNEELELLRQNNNIEEINFKAVDLSRILEDDIFKAFDAKLKAANFSSHEKTAVKEYFLKAMMESLS
ncbi:MAG: metallophosphoesterase [Spirochaetes bacterium]|nr:metallophosphoesterase [Spirochaetota bacterium]